MLKLGYSSVCPTLTSFLIHSGLMNDLYIYIYRQTQNRYRTTKRELKLKETEN